MRTRTRWRGLPLLLSALALATACGDDPGEIDPADSIVSMRISVANQTINVTESGVVTGGPIVITQGATFSLAAVFLDASNNQVAGLSDFELRVTPANTALVTFNRVTAFQGTLNRVAPGSTQLSIQLWHLIEQHTDFGPFNVPITVQ